MADTFILQETVLESNLREGVRLSGNIESQLTDGPTRITSLLLTSLAQRRQELYLACHVVCGPSLRAGAKVVNRESGSSQDVDAPHFAPPATS